MPDYYLLPVPGVCLLLVAMCLGSKVVERAVFAVLFIGGAVAVWFFEGFEDLSKFLVSFAGVIGGLCSMGLSVKGVHVSGERNVVIQDAKDAKISVFQGTEKELDKEIQE